MTPRTVHLLDSTGFLVAIVTVTEEADRYEGTIDLTATPMAMRKVFEEYEEVVNGQMFSFLDEVEAKVKGLQLKAVFSDEFSGPVDGLQVYPTSGEASFKLAVPATHNASP